MTRAMPGEAIWPAAPAGSRGRAMRTAHAVTRMGDSDDSDHGPHLDRAVGQMTRKGDSENSVPARESRRRAVRGAAAV